MFARARAGADGAGGGSGRGQPGRGAGRLTALWKDGALTDAEFADAKARLLPRIGR